jgi:serine/threonine protein kinase
LIKVTDFGLSRFIDLDAPTLKTRCGSEEYAAPELIMGQPYDGRQTDAWALGVVLFAILTSNLPFFAANTAISHEMPAKAAGRPTLQTEASTPDWTSRRSRLMRIAKAEYVWPEVCPLATGAARQVVDVLLVRDADQRARVDGVWELEWMRGTGSPARRKSRLKVGASPELEEAEDDIWVKPSETDEADLMRAEVEPVEPS